MLIWVGIGVSPPQPQQDGEVTRAPTCPAEEMSFNLGSAIKIFMSTRKNLDSESREHLGTEEPYFKPQEPADLPGAVEIFSSPWSVAES